MSAVTEHLELADPADVTPEEIAYFKLTPAQRAEAANELQILEPPLPPEPSRQVLEQPRARTPVNQQQYAQPQQRPMSPVRRPQSPMRRPMSPARPGQAVPGIPRFSSETERQINEEQYMAMLDEIADRMISKGLSIPDTDPETVLDPLEVEEIASINPDWRYDWDAYREEYEQLSEANRGVAGLGATRRTSEQKARAEAVRNKRLSRDAEKASQSLNTSHAQLVRTVWQRVGAAEALEGRRITPMRASDRGPVRKGDDPNELFLVLDDKIEDVQAWAGMAQSLGATRLLSWTTKMDCPSYSLPAGPTGSSILGSCPGAAGGQSISDPKRMQRQQAAVAEVHQGGKRRLEQLRDKPFTPKEWAETSSVNLADCVCQSCYAEKSHYAYTSNQLGALIRLVWTNLAVDMGTFVEVLDYAIKNADYKLNGDGKMPRERIKFADSSEPAKFFRIHDSGDFFSEKYFKDWVEIAALNPDVMFWAPTRVWAQGKNVDWVANARVPENLIIRPSAYMFNRPAGLISHLGHGYAAPSVSYSVDKQKPLPNYMADGDPYHWQCQAYMGEEGHSCRAAESPPVEAGGTGKVGCRACWIAPALSINYKKH